ncbi:hypothetical protein [Nonomuraea basaltis]|uniref:hypothetical protein n=1 Tax=Nonomuraea basaltis TaxID=2495887 RepID=UPI0014863546|nr:hypothetical protein [Nonomuraea basaltis]
MGILGVFFRPGMTCPTCDGEGEIVVMSLTGGKHLKSRKCHGCRGKGYLTR